MLSFLVVALHAPANVMAVLLLAMVFLVPELLVLPIAAAQFLVVLLAMAQRVFMGRLVMVPLLLLPSPKAVPLLAKAMVRLFPLKALEMGLLLLLVSAIVKLNLCRSLLLMIAPPMARSLAPVAPAKIVVLIACLIVLFVLLASRVTPAPVDSPLVFLLAIAMAV